MAVVSTEENSPLSSRSSSSFDTICFAKNVSEAEDLRATSVDCILTSAMSNSRLVAREDDDSVQILRDLRDFPSGFLGI
jgi:hypothetical protein